MLDLSKINETRLFGRVLFRRIITIMITMTKSIMTIAMGTTVRSISVAFSRVHLPGMTFP